MRTILKRVYAQWNAPLGQWRLKKIGFIFPDDDLPVHTAGSIRQALTWLGRTTNVGISLRSPRI